MFSIINDILESQLLSTTDSLLECEESMGVIEFRAGIMLLAQRVSGFVEGLPIELDLAIDFQRKVYEFLPTAPGFDEVFEVKNNVIDFRNDLPESDRIAVRKYVRQWLREHAPPRT